MPLSFFAVTDDLMTFGSWLWRITEWDIVPALILVFLVLMLWTIPKRSFGYNPLKNLFEWLRYYPFLAAIYFIFIMMSWGWIGNAFGLRNLLMADDWLTRFLCGFSLMAIFLRLSFQYVILDRSTDKPESIGGPKRQRWLWSLEKCLEIDLLLSLRAKVRLLSFDAPNADPHNNQLDVAELLKSVKNIRKPKSSNSASKPEGKSSASTNEEQISPEEQKLDKLFDSERFRISMASSIIDFYATILLVFLGLLPMWLPDFSFRVAIGRADWLLGVILGYFLARKMVQKSAEKITLFVDREIDQVALGFRPSERKEGRELENDWPKFKAMEVRSLIELVNLQYDNKKPEVSRSTEPPEMQIHYRRFRKYGVLAFSRVFGLLLQKVRAFVSSVRNKVESYLENVVQLLGLSTSVFAVIAVAAVSTAGIATFMIFAEPPWGSIETFIYIALATASSLLTLQFATKSSYAFSFPQEWENFRNLLKLKTILWLVPITMLLLLPQRLNPDNSKVFSEFERAVLIGLAKYAFAIGFGTMLVRSLMNRFDPLLAFPLSALIGFYAFAGFYVELPESSQARVPAAFTVIYFTGFFASLVTFLHFVGVFSRIERIAFGVLALILIVGQGWLSTPNQFELRFPGLDGRSMLPEASRTVRTLTTNYYENPVWLNSEAYFRSTNRSVIKLHSKTETEQALEDRSLSRGNRLASGLIPSQDGVGWSEGGFLFRFEDEHKGGNLDYNTNYLRVRAGDPLELTRIDTRFDCEVEGKRKLSIRLIPRGTDSIKRNKEDIESLNGLMEHIYKNAKRIRVKLTDRQEYDTGIEFVIERKTDPKNEGNQKNDGKPKWCLVWPNSNGCPEMPKIRFEGANLIVENSKDLCFLQNANDQSSDAKAIAIETALVTAIWDARVNSVGRSGYDDEKSRNRVEVRWPIGPAVETFRLPELENPDIVSWFLNASYLSAEVDHGDEKSMDLFGKIVAGPLQGSDNPKQKVYDLMAESTTVKGVSAMNNPSVEPEIGDCFTFEYLGWESPIRVADMVYLGKSVDSPTGKKDQEKIKSWQTSFRNYASNFETIWKVLVDDPDAYLHLENHGNFEVNEKDKVNRIVKLIKSQAKTRKSEKTKLFRLRNSMDSGIFAHDARLETLMEPAGEQRIIAIYGKSRVREHDRILLKWREELPADGDAGKNRRTELRVATYEVVKRVIADPTTELPLPPKGYAWYRIRPVDTRGTEIVTADDDRAFQDILPSTSRDLKIVGSWKRLELLDNYDALVEWKHANQRPNVQKPKLVIVTVSGGGIRSSVWTSKVLSTLERELGTDFSRSIRLITGASGGMVAASDFVESRYSI